LTSEKIIFIVNPHSGNGTTGREWPKICAAATARLGTFTPFMTSGPGDATKLARSHIMDGADLIVCVGGDGTLNEVVNGFMDEEGPIRSDVVLGFIPNGTGCDFVRTASIPRRISDSIDTIKAGHTCLTDIGRLRYRNLYDEPCIRYFHNIVSFGLGGEVADRVNRTSKAFGPFISFMWSTLIALLLYGKKKVRLKIDDGGEKEINIWNIAVANGQYHGGGMWVAPQAVLTDGLLNITVIGGLNPAQVLWHMPKLYNGKIQKIKEVSCLTGKRVEAFSDQPVLLEVDGEQPGRLPVCIDILPSAIRLIMKTC
jgi:YegS/Rv2252/BmrU family lipid kinase